jgi:endonuclease/exonuclease/phosphatase (EEP) superfamily protein YafD
VLAVIAAHPLPGRIRERADIPIGFFPGQRNADLTLLRARVSDLESAGSPVLLIGDFNTTPAEPAFGRLTAGLHDAHAEVGLGPGWTWRPENLEFLNTGLIRIDLVLTTPGLVPTSDSIECPPVGDHCYVEAGLSDSGRGG